jgi:hypothetical protein
VSTKKPTFSVRRARGALAVLLLAGAMCAVSVGSASAASFQLKLSSTHVAPGGHVTITTTPSMRCVLRLTIAGRHYSHLMPFGWIRVKMPANFKAGRVPISVGCNGQTVSSAFTVR